MRRVSVIGGGSFGTALAVLLAEKGNEISLWIRDENQRADIAQKRENEKYLKGVRLPSNINLPSTLCDAVGDGEFIVMAVPTSAFRETLSEIHEATNLCADGNNPAKIVVNVAKGIEQKSLKLLSQVAQEIDENIRFTLITGPSHAEEVCNKMPTTVAVSAFYESDAKAIAELFSTDRFRVYLNDDIIGVQLGGALKNIIALGAGISDGLGFGDNAKAALMTRGLTEIARLGEALGAKKETFLGLTGVGDLIVTCTSKHSRNRRCGYLIGRGYSADEAVEKIGMAVEGIYTIRSAYAISSNIGVSMPITEKLYDVIEGRVEPLKAVDILMGRERKYE